MRTKTYLKDIWKLFKSNLTNAFFKKGSAEFQNAKPGSFGMFAGFLSAFFVMVFVYTEFTKDTSSLDTTDKPIEVDKSVSNEQESRGPQSNNPLINALFEIENFYGSDLETSPKSGKRRVRASREYKAKQVIEREGGSYEREKTIPMGTNLIGKLLTSIDTRETEQFYKVFLPYGGNFKEGASIPKGSTLFGKVKYSGKGKKVFISFSKGVFPDGSEFEIEAQALSSKDYSPGIKGDFHGTSGARLAATLGLSIVSGATAVLTEREQVGNLGASLPKATARNAMYGGLSQAASQEAERRSQSLSEKQEYITVDAGKDLIISLTKGYSQK